MRTETRRPVARQKVALRTRIGSYFFRHRKTLAGSLRRLASQPTASIMTIAVIAIALALPAALHVLVINAKSLGGRWESVTDLSVYLAPATAAKTVEALATRLRERPDIAAIETVSADEGLAEFRAMSGFGSALDALTANPLPPLLIVRPARDAASPEAIDKLAAELRALPEADIVQSDTAWVARFNAIVDLIRRTVVLASALLAGAVIVIVGNTIRLDIQNRRDEIEITRLIGASDAFVRQPFLYTGLWYGLAGGVGALLLIEVTLVVLAGPVARIAGLYGSAFTLTGPGPRAIVALVGGGAALGWLGSWVAASRHMRKMNPM